MPTRAAKRSVAKRSAVKLEDVTDGESIRRECATLFALIFLVLLVTDADTLATFPVAGWWRRRTAAFVVAEAADAVVNPTKLEEAVGDLGR